jgi:hypothetical protein
MAMLIIFGVAWADPKSSNRPVALESADKP